MEEVHTAEELVEEASECGGWDGRAGGLGMVVDDLLRSVQSTSHLWARHRWYAK